MREEVGTGIVHIADSDCNPQVVSAIRDAKLAKDARAYIDYLSGGKPWSYASKIENTENKKVEEMER